MTRNSDTPSAPDARRSGPRRLRVPAVLFVLALLFAPLAVYLYHHRPNLYDRTRTDLLEAERELDIYSKDMVQLTEKNRQGDEALKATIRWLREAAASDPADLAEIDAIAATLRDLEDPVHAGELSADELRDRYSDLYGRLQRLVDRRAHGARSRPR
jgi:hypothetical protein